MKAVGERSCLCHSRIGRHCRPLARRDASGWRSDCRSRFGDRLPCSGDLAFRGREYPRPQGSASADHRRRICASPSSDARLPGDDRSSGYFLEHRGRSALRTISRSTTPSILNWRGGCAYRLRRWIGAWRAPPRARASRLSLRLKGRRGVPVVAQPNRKGRPSGGLASLPGRLRARLSANRTRSPGSAPYGSDREPRKATARGQAWPSSWSDRLR